MTATPMEQSSMHIPSVDFAADPRTEILSNSRKGRPATGRSPLSALLAHTIQLRDLYKCARRHVRDDPSNQLHRMINDHYQGQLRLVDVLINRLRTVGGEGVFAGDLFQKTNVPFTVCGSSNKRRMLLVLLETHDTIITAAQPGGGGGEKDGSAWFQDYAVGQVVLTNQLHMQGIEDVLAASGQEPDLLARIALMAD